MKMKKIMFMIFVLFMLTGCEKQEKTEEISNGTSQRNETINEQEENKDYEIKNLEISDIEKKQAVDSAFQILEQTRAFYELLYEENQGNGIFAEQNVHEMVETIAKDGTPVTCGSYDYNMMNYAPVDDVLKEAKKGKSGDIRFVEINTSGTLIYHHLQFQECKLTVLTVIVTFNEDMEKVLQQVEKIQVYDWQYTDKGWLIWEKALSRNREMDMHVFYRILPLDEKSRYWGNICITPVSYFCNNLFLVDWNQNNMEEIEFNDLFDFLYQMKYGKSMDREQFVSGIPKEEFEKVVKSYFDISTQELEKIARYDGENNVYPWEPIESWNRISQFQSFPEVVKCVENQDGTLTLFVEAVFQEGGTDCLFEHEVKIKDTDDGWIYLGNVIHHENADYIPQYKPRRTFGNN